ncbi:MAG: cation:proton antiporter [Myxococcota bacterium]|nr:cation:proton antiporter [Myxococcota bacterium]
MDPASFAVVALAICVFAAISRKAERSPLTPPMFFVGAGLLLGGAGLGWLDLDVEGEGIHLLAEITLVLVLFTDAARIDLACLIREKSLPARLLGIGMPLTIAAGAVTALLLFPGLSAMEALLLAAILAPTDAALGQAVVSNPLVPVRIRQSLNVESGLNDGIALPVVLVLASLAGAREEAGDAGYWIRFAALAVTLGPLVGAVVGFVGGRVVAWGTSRGWINDAFQRISGIGIAFLAFGAAEVVGGNGFIAAFVAGLTVGNTAREVCTCLYEFGEAEGQLLTLLVFLVFGAMMVPEALHHGSGAVWLYALLSLTVVRMLPVSLSLLGSGLRPASFAFLGWFGPRGLASILFALVVVEEGRLETGALLEAVVVTTVLLSAVLHGTTAWPFARRYGEFVTALREAEAERAHASEMPVRIRHVAMGGAMESETSS